MDSFNEQPISSENQADLPQSDTPMQYDPLADYKQSFLYTSYPGYATMNGGAYPYPVQPEIPQNVSGDINYQRYPIMPDPVSGSYSYRDNPYNAQYVPPYYGAPQEFIPSYTDPLHQEQIFLSNQVPTDEQDYSHFTNPARIAIYDDLRSAPRVIQVEGGPTHEFIERIASLTYQNAQDQGGMIPYTVIREVSENFIHASFKEVVISVLDKGNTIRFTDQGPGIKHKDLVQKPGFTSATEPMKRYIRGVGSGFPLMHDYLTAQKGYYTIEDNTDGGAVITISLMPRKEMTTDQNLIDQARTQLTSNEKSLLRALLPHEVLGVTELHNKTGIAVSSVHNALSKLMDAGLIQQQEKKRVLTDIGYEIALTL